MSENAAPVFNCPLCDGIMTPVPDGKNYYIKCFNACDPLCNETVTGHGGTLKEAHVVACQKYIKSPLAI